jgi:glycosyltransferase involved in cell wall biosynthesis
MLNKKSYKSVMNEQHPSLHVLGGRQFGGADQFYVRLVRALSEAGQPVTAINRRGSPVAAALAGTPVEQIHFPFANIWDAWTLWQMRRLVASRGPVVVQTYMGRATRLTRLPKNTPAVHVCRLGGYYKLDGYYRHAHAWIGNTQGICDYLVQGGMPASRVFKIGNFVPDPQAATEAERADLRRERGIPEGAWALLALGRFTPAKGFDDLLRAAARLPAEIAGRPWVLLLAGDGPLAESLRGLAAELGLEGRVRWLGWQSVAYSLYALADAFICPSRHEPLGNVILEAWSHGLPVVSTATQGATELIEDGCTGLMSPCADPEALAGGIKAVLEAPEAFRQSLGEAGRRAVREQFSREAVLGAYIELYGRLLAERGMG